MKRLLVYFITVCILSASMLGLYTGVNAEEVPAHVIQIAGDDSSYLALKSDGTVWEGTATNKYIPVQVKALTDVISVAFGSGYGIALKADGTVWTWGYNRFGQLGDGTNNDSTVPVQVIDNSGNTLTDVIKISSDYSYQTLALKKDGTVWAWGTNYYGQLGIGTSKDSNRAVQVIGENDNENKVEVISGGDSNGSTGSATGTSSDIYAKKLTGVTDIITENQGHSLALKGDGTIVGWGLNQFGELGDNKTESSTGIPVKVHNMEGISAIFASHDRSYAIKKDGTVWGWGDNSAYELGDGTNIQRNEPVRLPALDGAKQICGGWTSSGLYTIFLKNDGTVWGVGANKVTPEKLPDFDNAISINSGWTGCYAIKNDGSVWRFVFLSKPVKIDALSVALPTATATPTPTATATATATPTPTATATPTPTATATATATPAATATPIVTPTATPIPSPTSTPALNSVTPSTVTYDARKLPAFSVNISTPYNLVDVKNGTTSLISGKDYTVSGSTLSIAQGYFNYYFNKFPNQDLKFVLKFSAGNDVTLTVKPFWEVLADIAPSELKINKASIVDVPVTMTLNGSTLVSVNNGTSALTSNDYTVSGNVVTIKKSYITYYTTKFPTQNLNLIFKFSNGYDKVLSLYIGDSPNTVINPTTVTYTVGSKADVNVNATMNGNFFSSIKNGTSDLVPKVDYTYDPNTNALCIRSNYMAYFFSKFNQDLVLTVNLTGGKPATLTIKPSFTPTIKGVAVTAKAGQKVSYVVKASSIKDLGKFIVDIDYDPAKMMAESVQEGNVKRAGYINYFGDADFSSADTGTVSVLSSDDLPTQSKDGDLFTIVFDVKPGASGTADIKIKAEIYDLTTTPIPVKVEAGSITITN